MKNRFNINEMMPERYNGITSHGTEIRPSRQPNPFGDKRLVAVSKTQKGRKPAAFRRDLNKAYNARIQAEYRRENVAYYVDSDGKPIARVHGKDGKLEGEAFQVDDQVLGTYHQDAIASKTKYVNRLQDDQLVTNEFTDERLVQDRIRTLRGYIKAAQIKGIDNPTIQKYRLELASLEK